MKPTHRARSRRRDAPRAAAIAGIIVMLLVADLIVIGMLVGGRRDHRLTARRLESIQAFYAAAAGMNMAVRELMENVDEDGDGTIGTISDDGNDANDPAAGTARIVVTSSTSGSETTLTAVGRSGQARRELQAVIN